MPSTATVRHAIGHLLEQAVRDRVIPGAVWAFGDAHGVIEADACGMADPPTGVPMRLDTVFDLASLTKIVAVWAVIGSLWEEGALELDEPLGTFWPEVRGHPLAPVTARHLLTHTAGVPLRANLKALYGTDPRAIRDGVLREALHRPPGRAVEYTCRAALILAFLAEHLTGVPLDRLAEERIWRPLGMADTGYGPLPGSVAARCAVTEYDPASKAHLRGVAHDHSARLLGVSGNAGMFSTLADLSRFQRHLLDPGLARCGFGAAWVGESLRVQTGALAPARGLFWHPVPCESPSYDVFAHYGFTGTGMWVSQSRGRWAVLLTNRVFYSRAWEPIFAVRKGFRELVFADRSALAAPTSFTARRGGAARNVGATLRMARRYARSP